MRVRRVKKNDGRNRIIGLAAVLLIAAAAVFACVYLIKAEPSEEKNVRLSFLSGTEDKLGEMTGGHEDEDCYTGVGGRSDTEAEIDYMILKYTGGLEELKRKESEEDEDQKKGEEDQDGKGEEDEEGKEEDKKKKDTVDENWKDIIFATYKEVGTQTEFCTDKDVKEEEVIEAICTECRYRTGEDGIFLTEYYYNFQQNPNGTLFWNVSVGYSRGTDEIKGIKEQTSGREDAEIGTLDFSGMTDLEKIDLINQYVCDNVEYHPGIPGLEDPYPDQSHTAYGALFEKYAVCDGFSRLTKMMCDDVGLDCYIVIGEVIGGGGHAWNLVKIDGQWYHLDTTWNDGCGDRSQYFLIPDSYFDGYRIWNRDMYPPVATAPYLR